MFPYSNIKLALPHNEASNTVPNKSYVSDVPLETQHTSESCYGSDPEISRRSVNSVNDRWSQMRTLSVSEQNYHFLWLNGCLTSDWSRQAIEL